MSPAKHVEKLYLETRVSPPWQVHGSLTPEPDRAGTLTLGVSAVGSECLADTELAFGRGLPGPAGLTPSHGSPRPLRRNPCSTSRAPALLPQPGPFLLSPLGPPQPTRPQSGPHLGLPAFLGTPVTSQALPCRAPQLTARRPSTHVFGPLKSGVSGRGACALPPYAHTHCPAPSAAPAWTLTWHLLTSTLPPLIWHLAPALSTAVPTIAEQSLDN